MKKAKRHPLTRWRFDHDITLAQLAVMLDPPSTPGYLSDIEAGKREPSINFARKIIALTGLKIGDFAHMED